MSYPNQWNMGLPGGQQPQQNPAMVQGLGMSNPFGSTGVGSPHMRSQPTPQGYAPQAQAMGYGSPHLPQQMLGGVGMQQTLSRGGSPAPQLHNRTAMTGQIASSMLSQSHSPMLPQQPPPPPQQPPARPPNPVNIHQLLTTPNGKTALAAMLNKTGGANSQLLAHLTPAQKAMVIKELQRPTTPQPSQHPHPPPIQQGNAQNQNFSLPPAALANFPQQPVLSSPQLGGAANLPRPAMPTAQSLGPTGTFTPGTRSPGTFQTSLPAGSSQAPSSAAVSSPNAVPAPRKRKAAPAVERETQSPAASSPVATPSALQTPKITTRDFGPSVMQPTATPPAPPSVPTLGRGDTPSVLLPPRTSSNSAAPASSYAPTQSGPLAYSPARPIGQRPPQTVFFAGQPPSAHDRDLDREAALEKERDRIRAIRAKENEHASRKRESMRGQMRNEVARLMFAAGDVHEPDQNSVDYMEDLLVEFVSDLCRPIAPIRPNPQSSRQIVPLTPAIVRDRLSAPNPLLRKYAERFDYMTYMSGNIAEARRVDQPTNEDLVKTVGSSFLGLQDGGDERKAGRPKKKKARDEPSEPKEKKRPGPRKGWKNDNEALERVRQKKEVKKGRDKEKIKARLAVKSEAA